MTAVGEDKPGNLFAVARDIAEVSCTIWATFMTVLQARTMMVLTLGVPAAVTREQLDGALTRSRDSGLDVRVGRIGPAPVGQRAGNGKYEGKSTPWHFMAQAPDQPGILAAVARVLVEKKDVDVSRLVARVANKVAFLDIDLMLGEEVDGAWLHARLENALDSVGQGWMQPIALSAGAHGPVYQYQWSGRSAGEVAVILSGEAVAGGEASGVFAKIWDALVGVPCNVEAAARTMLGEKSAVLGDRSVLMLVVKGVEERELTAVDIEEVLGPVRDKARLDMACCALRNLPRPQNRNYIGQRWHFVSHVAEQPGVLRSVTEVFAQRVNICEARTQVVGSPPLCTVDLDVVVGDDVPFAEVCQDYRERVMSMGCVKADFWEVTSY